MTIIALLLACEHDEHRHQLVDADASVIDAAVDSDASSTDTTDTELVDMGSTRDRFVDMPTLDAQTPAPVYAKDDELRVNHLQALGTHNSYHLAPDLMFLPWNYDHLPLDQQLRFQGVRQFELDIYQNQIGTFDVYHILFADDGTTCATLTECLTVMKTWSDDNQGHHPILVLIEPKGYLDPPDMVIAKLNAALMETWGAERLLTPAMIKRDLPTIRDGLAAQGWPTLGATRNRLIAVLHTPGELRDANLDADYNGLSSVMFSDAYGDVNAPFAAYHSMNNPIGGQAAINALVQANHLVRTRADTDGEETQTLDYERAEAALRSGAHFISTDFPFEAAPEIYGFTIPMGTPSRCNPVQSPQNCMPRDIEYLHTE